MCNTQVPVLVVQVYLNIVLQTIIISNSSSIALTYDFRDTTKMFNRSIEGQIHRVWHKLPEGLIEQGKSKGWLSITKGCQRYLASKTMAQGFK